jgi:transposase-like protein
MLDALTQRVREGGRVVNVAAVIATAVNNEGTREIIGFEIATTEDSAAGTEFLRSLVARGSSGVELVISDAHELLHHSLGLNPHNQVNRLSQSRSCQQMSLYAALLRTSYPDDNQLLSYEVLVRIIVT